MFSAARLERLMFLIIALLLLSLSFVLYYRIQELITSYKLINHSHDVELKLEQTFSYVKGAETSQRGFLLTKDSAFLPLFYDAQMKTDSLIQDLRKSTKDNQQQQVNLNTLQYLINYRFTKMNYLLAKHDSVTKDGLDGISLDRLHGRSMMDSIRYHVNQMMNEEARVKQQREKVKNEYLSLTPKAILVLVLFALSMLVFSFYRINHQLKIKAHYAKLLSNKNEELELKNQELKKTNEELFSFNYITSHDLREPLRKIKTFNSLLVQDSGLSQDSKYYIDRVQKITNHMQSLLDDLLTFSTISNQERHMEPVNLNGIMEKVKETLGDEIKESDASIIYEDLPVITGIPFQLEHLFENLISNSIKYRQANIAPEISIKTTNVAADQLPTGSHTNHHSFICLAFSDNGSGFDQRFADKVFELFQRLHEKREDSGTGIGLAICRKVVNNHDGFITVHSKVGDGTVFNIFLPNDQQQQEETKTAATREANGS